MSAEDRNILKAKEETLQKVLKDTGADQSLLKKLDIIAINQEELASLIDADEPQIYLCSNSFSIPISKPGHEYIGIGDVQIDNPFTNEQYSKAGITVTNITLPVTQDPDTSLAASQAAAVNGYDSFHESHSALATLFHNTLKANRIYEVYSLPFNASVMGKFYNSRSEALLPKRQHSKKHTTQPPPMSLRAIPNALQNMPAYIMGHTFRSFSHRRSWMHSKNCTSFTGNQTASGRSKTRSPTAPKICWNCSRPSCLTTPTTMPCTGSSTSWIRLRLKNTITV